MNTEKQFVCPATPGAKSLGKAAYIGFCNRIEFEGMAGSEAEALFDALAVGETLVDEDGDTWERIA